jgi:hypothetical protein
MAICGNSAEGLAELSAGQAWLRAWSQSRSAISRRMALPGVAAFAFVAALGGCTSNDSGELLIDPGRYSIYKCDDLAARWKLVSAREKELRGLMDKAGQSGGGVVVGMLAYRAQYDAVVSDERLLQRTAAEKNCGLSFQSQNGQPLNAQFRSDQSIR